MEKQTTILVRRGVNGFKYSACNSCGYFIGNFSRLADIRKHWGVEIKRGHVVLVRELDKVPDMSKLDATQENIKKILQSYAKRK